MQSTGYLWLIGHGVSSIEWNEQPTLCKGKPSGSGHQNSDWITAVESFSPIKPHNWARVQTKVPGMEWSLGPLEEGACYAAKNIYCKFPFRLLVHCTHVKAENSVVDICCFDFSAPCLSSGNVTPFSLYKLPICHSSIWSVISIATNWMYDPD